MAKSKKSGSSGTDDKKLFAFLGVFLTIIGFVIALAAKKDDKYVMFYGKQGLVLFIAWAIAWAVMMIPFIGWVVGWILYLCVFVLWIIGIIYSFSGEMKPVPVIGQFAEKIKI